MSDEQRMKGVEERKQYAEPSEAGRAAGHTEEPEVEGHLFVTGAAPERRHKKSGEVDRRSNG
jgi:hypothetical protein